MANRSSGNVRIGPVGIFTLIILLCLSVMAVLTAATAHASLTSAEKQAAYATSTYDNEGRGWEAVSIADNALSQSTASNRRAAAAQAASAINDAAIENVTATAEEERVLIQAVAENGRRLDIVLDVTPELRGKISSWTVTTESQSSGNDDVLWTNNL